MKFSLLFASGVLAFVAVVGAQASYGNEGRDDRRSYPVDAPRYEDNGCGYDCRNSLSYNSNDNANSNYNANNYNGNQNNQYNGNQESHYNGNQESHHNSQYQQPGARQAYGPYHSYAVRPAIYGGHGMYHYRGYARHPLPPANALYRPVRSYGSSSGSSSSHYGMRPVRALVLAPAYSGNSGPYAHLASGPRHYNSNSNQGNNYRAPRGYGQNQHGAGGARHYRAAHYSAHNSGSQYHNDAAPAARYNRGGSRYHHGGAAATAGGY